MAETFAVLTGPIRGSLFLADGTEVDCTPSIAYVASAEEAHELGNLTGLYWTADNTPEHPDFVGQPEVLEAQIDLPDDYVPNPLNPFVVEES